MTWQPMKTAPKDGTEIEVEILPYPFSAWDGPQIIKAHWIDFNGGGWTWYGSMGRFNRWREVTT